MSEQNDLHKKLMEDNEIYHKQEEVKRRQLAINDYKTKNEIDRINDNLRISEVIKGVNFGLTTAEETEKRQQNNKEYFEAVKNSFSFINKMFDKIVPFFRKNLILVGGKTGEGKSTTTANIVTNMLGKRNPVTGKPCRALIITNEELPEDILNRITCLLNGWGYNNHENFTQEQKDTMANNMPKLSRFVQIVNDTFGSTESAPLSGITTTIEGIRSIFDNLIANQDWFDVIIIDYYQKINKSSRNVYAKPVEVLDDVANMLDHYKNTYPAPIVVMAQVQPTDKEETPFEIRMKGRKSICEKATFIMEMIADPGNLRTQWVFHKSRFTDSRGQTLTTGYDRGKFVEYNEDFCRKVNMWKEQKQFAATVGKNVFNKESSKDEKKD